MENDAIKDALLAFSQTGVCDTGKRWLRAQKLDIDTLVHVWRRWPEYLYEHYEFAISVLRGKLGPGELDLLKTKMLYVDRTVTVDALFMPGEPIYLLGTSDVCIRLSEYACAKIFCFGESKLSIEGDETTRMSIELFNHSSLKVSGGAVPSVYLYDNASVEGDARIRMMKYERGRVFNGKENGIPDTGKW